ncbi:NAD(P)-binding domain-containing protein, partial [Enterococcus sp. 2201sp1_2201st1_C11_2201SCRN_220225]|uniref:NAD(P)-binding domain-containing protein n=1 Tax=Enterococcus sp. 2201sp1_2201st1_C11_2201SCRN_220225 TaxID=3141593 RepID=UPI0034A1E212
MGERKMSVSKIGFYGTGNMGQAMMKGLVKAGIYQPAEIVIYDTYEPIREK